MPLLGNVFPLNAGLIHLGPICHPRLSLPLGQQQHQNPCLDQQKRRDLYHLIHLLHKTEIENLSISCLFPKLKISKC